LGKLFTKKSGKGIYSLTGMLQGRKNDNWGVIEAGHGGIQTWGLGREVMRRGPGAGVDTFSKELAGEWGSDDERDRGEVPAPKDGKKVTR